MAGWRGAFRAANWARLPRWLRLRGPNEARAQVAAVAALSQPLRARSAAPAARGPPGMGPKVLPGEAARSFPFVAGIHTNKSLLGHAGPVDMDLIMRFT